MADDQNEKIVMLEKRIETGDIGPDFHLFVQKEIYPLLFEEEITPEQFTRLVQKYSRINDPYKIVNK